MLVENFMKSIIANASRATRRGGVSIVAAVAAAGILLSLLAGCGGGGGGGGGTTVASSVALSGTVTWGGTQVPNKLVTVQGTSNSTTTNSSGQYSLTVQPNQTITLAVQENAAGSGCTIAQDPVDFTQSVVVGGSSTQTANIAIPANNPPPPPPLCGP
jgi:hypothetical protein